MNSTTVLRRAAQVLKVAEEAVAQRTNQLIPYTAPRWASKLKNQPKHYIELAQKPTPIQAWNFGAAPGDFELDIKRDDLNGHVLSGSKLRKLEFIFADAISKNSTCVITCGDVVSNHCRATSIAAKKLGLDCHLLLRSHEPEEHAKASDVMLDYRINDAECYTVPYQPLCRLDARLYQLAHELKKSGEKPYIIAYGGSDHLGTFGVVNSFRELIKQDVLDNYDDVVVSASSGGTLAGLAIANYLTGEKVRIHGVSVSENYNFFSDHIKDTLLAYGLPRGEACEICDVIDGEKVARNQESELDTLTLDPSESLLNCIYTANAVKGMMNEMKVNPNRFKGKRVLFMHTGGSFSVFDGQVDESVLPKSSDNVHVWKDSRDNPLKFGPKHGKKLNYLF